MADEEAKNEEAEAEAPEEGFAAFRRQQTGHGGLHVVHQIVDHVVVTQVHRQVVQDRGLLKL